MGSAFFTALSGLHANSTAIDITANNLANVDTVGYKSQTASFSDLFAQEMEVPGLTGALGTGVPAATTHFLQGALATGQASLDAAIGDNGNDFFITQGAQGVVYTRAGQFQAGTDAAGNQVLFSESGNVVEGYAVGPDGQLSTNLNAIVLPGESAPTQTTAIAVQVNLDSGAPAGTSVSWSQNVVDGAGGTHPLALYFTRGATPGAWTLTTQVDGQPAGNPVDLTFDPSGNLTSPTAVNINAGGQTIAMPLVDASGKGLLTQYASPSTLGSFQQDGKAASAVTGYSIGDGGLVVASLADGSTMNVARLALSQIGNPGSMKALGSGDYVVTEKTGAPITGNALTLDTQIVGGALENSTANIADEMTNLIVYQRAYQASSKAIITNDQMLQQLYQLVT